MSTVEEIIKQNIQEALQDCCECENEVCISAGNVTTNILFELKDKGFEISPDVPQQPNLKD